MTSQTPNQFTLTDEQISRYKRDGFLTFDPLLDATEVEQLSRHIDGLIAGLPPDKQQEEMMNYHYDDAYLYGVCTDRRWLDLVEPLLGPDLVLWGVHILCKAAGVGKRVAWHQDHHDWPISPIETATVWVAVDDVDVENGCMRVIPGTHKMRDLAYQPIDYQADDARFLNDELAPSSIDESAAVDIELKTGGCSIHEAHLVHGSNANRSTRRRCGMILRFMPAHCRLDPDVWSGVKLFLVRGKPGANDYAQPPR